MQGGKDTVPAADPSKEKDPLDVRPIAILSGVEPGPLCASQHQGHQVKILEALECAVGPPRPGVLLATTVRVRT